MVNITMIYALTDFTKFSADSQRVISNVESAYDAWVETSREIQSLPVSMYWVTRGDTDYLSVKRDSADSGTTQGKRSEETEREFESYQKKKSALKVRLATLGATLTERIALYRALHLPRTLDRQAEILRTLDIAGKLSTDLMVVGSNAFSAYELHCGARFPTGNEETEDFDLAWCRGSNAAKFLNVPQAGVRKAKTLLDILHSIDTSYKINNKKPYQAVADDRYEVELLICVPP